jgi:hypothetical protein
MSEPAANGAPTPVVVVNAGPPRRTSHLFMIVVGALIGLLVGVLAIPSREQRLANSELDAVAGPDGAATVDGALPVDGATAEGGTGTVSGGAAGGATGAAGRRTAAGGGNVALAGGVDRTLGDVVGDTIRIGIGVPDLGALAALGPNYDFGDPQDHMAALLEGWQDAGRVPVHGRDIEFFFRRYEIVGTEEQRAACIGWARDDRVFAVVAVNQFWAQPQCLTAENKIPLITSQGYPDRAWVAAGPYLFDLQPSLSRTFRNLAHWAHHRNLVKGRRIGIYYAAGADAEVVKTSLITELHELGYGPQIAAEVTTGNSATGGPEDSVAVRRFQAAQVEVAILLVSAINQTNFMQQAQAVGYRPAYLETDYFATTNDTATSTFPAGHFDGNFGMTSLRFGEIRSGLGMTPAAQQCVANYARQRGRTITYESRPAEWMMLQQGCDEGAILLAALERAGPQLTKEKFLAALGETRNVAGGVHPSVSFLPGVFGGTHDQRTLQWHAACTCWKATGSFAPFWVP